jgi:hypothetical protein
MFHHLELGNSPKRRSDSHDSLETKKVAHPIIERFREAEQTVSRLESFITLDGNLSQGGASTAFSRLTGEINRAPANRPDRFYAIRRHKNTILLWPPSCKKTFSRHYQRHKI